MNEVSSGRLARFGKLARMGAKAAFSGVGSMADTLGELKGIATKAGQALAMFGDELPPEGRIAMARLLNQVPTLPYEAIAEVIRAELGADPEALFLRFEHTPLAAASFAQVHAATLAEGEVVVKVQYPRMAAALAADLANAGSVVTGLSLAFGDAKHQFDEISAELRAELDYRGEHAWRDRYAEAVARFPDILVPRVFASHSSGRVLTLERFFGPTLQAFAEDVSNDEAARTRVAEQLMRAVWAPFIHTGLIHGDPHPGNYIVLGENLGVLDFGCMKQHSASFQTAIVQILRAHAEGRPIDAVTSLTQAGFSFPARTSPMADALVALITDPTGPGMRTLQKLKTSQPREVLRTHMPSEATLFMRALMSLGHDLKLLRVKYAAKLVPLLP